MAHGGRRPGAGRRAGSKGKRTIGLEAAVADAAGVIGEGLKPLDYLLAVLRNPKNPTPVRMEAANALLPYMHRRQPQDVRLDATVHTPLPVVLVHTAPPRPADLDPVGP